MDKTKARFEIASKKSLIVIFSVLLGIEITIVLLDGFITYGRVIDIAPIRGMLNITREDGLATWFSCLQAAFVGISFILVGRCLKSSSDPLWKRLGWYFFGFFFLFLSMDDGAMIHERLGSTVEHYSSQFSIIENSETLSAIVSDFPSYHWHLVVMPVFLLIGIMIFVFLWVELKTLPLRLMLLFALGCYALSQGLDFFEEIREVHYFLRRTFGLDDEATRHFSKSIEEFMEMFGTTLFLILGLSYLTKRVGEIQIHFVSVEPDSE